MKSDKKVVAKRDLTEPSLDENLKWNGEGPAPKYWFANDKDGNLTQVYRSYEDYCNG